MSCIRHSYPKGSIKGQRQCQKCKAWDKPPAEFDLSEFLGESATPALEPASAEIGGVSLGPDTDIPVTTSVTGVGIDEFMGGDDTGPLDGDGASSPSLAVEPTLVSPSFTDPIALGPGLNPSPLADAPSEAGTVTVEPVVSASIGALPTVAPDAHSKLGASSAERWMECPGSVELIHMLDGYEAEDPDYRSEGILAHSLAAHCLDNEIDAWEAMALGKFAGVVSGDISRAVQVYLDYVRSRPGRRRVEIKAHRPELHPLMFGTIDCELVPVGGAGKLAVEIVDYKNGAGVFVSAVKNVQMRYYAALVIYEEPDFYPDDGEVRLTIVQPNYYAEDGAIRTWTTTVGEIREWVGAIRTWTTTVGEIREWVRYELLPAMARTITEKYLSIGKWCQFCPAKLACPAMSERATEYRQHAADLIAKAGTDAEHPLAALADEVLGRHFEEVQALRYYMKAVETEVYRRLMDRRNVPGARLGYRKTDRVFKDKVTIVDVEGKETEVTLEQAAGVKFGTSAYTKAVLLSPAQMEKLPDGKGFVAEWAYKPEAGYRVEVADDGRPGVIPKSGEALHAQAVQKYLDTVTE